MLHDIEPALYDCTYTDKAPDPAKDVLLSYKNDTILLDGDALPRLSNVNTGTRTLQFLFTIDDVGFYLCDPPLEESGALHYDTVHRLRQMTDGWQAFAGATGYHLAVWYHNNRHCGVCGTRRIHDSELRALVCPNCGHVLFPQIAVAIIVGIIDGDRLLLSRYARGVYKNYALIAGYVEIGETLEAAVRREIAEEVGLRVKNIRYYTSQPWGFSQSLLVGFFADLDGSPDITLETNELAEAVWMHRDDVPPGNAAVSMTGRMIEAFRHGDIL